jgi:RHS repeat-associated protein
LERQADQLQRTGLSRIKYGGNNYYYICNLQNDIIGILDSAGTQVVSYVYDSWGKLISISGSAKDMIGVKNPFRYRGYYYDMESGLYYLNSRYYDPEIGRFLNADAPKIIDGGNDHILENNLFAYCFNNPVNMTDDTGHWPKWATKLAIGVGAIVVGVAVVAAGIYGGLKR